MISPLVEQARKIYVAKPLGLVSFCPDFQHHGRLTPLFGMGITCSVCSGAPLSLIFELADGFAFVAFDGVTVIHREALLRWNFGNMIPE
jgi:hypothetical protein